MSSPQKITQYVNDPDEKISKNGDR